MATKKNAMLGATWTIALLILAAPAAARAEVSGQIAGTYVFAGGGRERAAHGRALDEAASELNAVLRPVGRAALGRHLGIPRQVEVATFGDMIALTNHPFPPRRSRLDGTAVTFDNTRGQPSVMRRVVQGATIVETIVAGDITRVIRYRFSDDSSRLYASWQVSIPQYLSRPVRFTLTYRRQ
jgi:hypothetical protein